MNNAVVTPDQMTLEKWLSLFDDAGITKDEFNDLRVVVYAGPLVITRPNQLGHLLVLDEDHAAKLKTLLPEIEQELNNA